MSRQDEPEPDFERLLEYLRRSRGFDFTGYKRTSLMRRVSKRMQMVGVQGYDDYVDYLEVHPDEFGHLFDTILINVTAFFRDPGAWEAVSEQIIPRLLAGKRPDDPIRLWSAGCASGEEAFTLAMVLAEAIGIEPFRDRVKIYATDVDDDALARARHAGYGPKEVEAIPPEILARYFEASNGRFSFQKDLRRSVIFGRHDLIQDAPISRIDLLTCRNTLMYFNTETQARILDRFHFALNERGFLFLGKAETLLTYNNTFVPIDLKRRIFAKVTRGSLRERLMVMARSGSEEAVNHLVGHVRVREASFDACPIAQLVVDHNGQLAMANDRARVVFGLAPSDLGRPLQDLQISYRPADLRSCIDRAYVERRPVVLPEVEWSVGPGDPSYLDIHVVPLLDPSGTLLGAGITFLDVTASRRLKADLQSSHKELETAYEELQSTNEELETTNEELQSTVEELETTNEELQSTNEELETMNEELQSTNEELETVNEELRQRSDELKQVNIFLESILGSLRGGVVVIDADFLVHVWNEKAVDLWGLRADEVRGKNLLNLDIGLPVEGLKPLLLTCLAGEAAYQEVTLKATNRRGRAIQCRVTCTPMDGLDGIDGAILQMDDLSESPSGDGEPAERPGGRVAGDGEGAVSP
jgi:two-component system, chemotaxis family, CheB/CheR fusion protein